jgi:thiol:disulfide interchange protein DsbD
MEQHIKWSYSSKVLPNNEVSLRFKAKIDKDHHIYALHDDLNPFEINIEESISFKLKGKVKQFGKPHKGYDELMMANREEFQGTAEFEQIITVLSKDDFKLAGSLYYQICKNEGTCAMLEPEFSFDIKGATEIIEEPVEIKKDAAVEENVENKIADTENDSTLIKVENTNISNSKKNHSNMVEGLYEIKDGHKQTVKLNVTDEDKGEGDSDALFTLFWLAFLGGLAAIFTPCVFPMIPMTVSFFMHDGQSKAKARFEALVYSLSIIVIYTVIGTIVAVTLGANFANWLSTHWIPNVAFFIIFVVFAASFFGMFEITMPSWMVNKSDKQADKGGILGAFFMAFTLVLVSFSCTGPIVGGILVASAGGQVLMPIVGMLGFSLAFALPFGVFAFFPSLLQGMPKSGGWLNSVKVVLGFIELALGLKFLSIADLTYHWHILDREVYLALWIVIFTLMGIYLLGKIKFAHDSEVKHIGVPRLIMVIITFSFVIYMIPGMFGAPLKVLSGYLPPQQTLDYDLERIGREHSENVIEKLGGESKLCFKPKYGDFLHLPHGLHGYYTYEEALACAIEQGKPIFLDFTGHGCTNCRDMESSVWKDPSVLSRLEDNFVIFSCYVDDKTDLSKEDWILSREDNKIKKTLGKVNADFQIYNFGENSQPVYAILDHKGNVMNGKRSYDKDISAFVKFLDKGQKEFTKSNK